MELKDFISQTLIQTIQGIKLAQDQATELKASVNPVLVSAFHNRIIADSRIAFLGGLANHTLLILDFDIAVTASDSKGISGGASINVIGIKAGGEGETASSNVQQNRIKFLIPIVPPTQALP